MGFDGFPGLVAGDLGTVRQSLAGDVHENNGSPLNIVDAERLPVVPAEVELGRITLKMLFADRVECAIQAALQDCER